MGHCYSSWADGGGCRGAANKAEHGAAEQRTHGNRRAYRQRRKSQRSNPTGRASTAVVCGTVSLLGRRSSILADFSVEFREAAGQRTRYGGAMFRPCIDLRDGKVVQIVGGTAPRRRRRRRRARPPSTSSASCRARWYAARYRDDGLPGGHVVMLGPGNDDAALDAIAAWPGGLQVGGGITVANAADWLDAGASPRHRHVMAVRRRRVLRGTPAGARCARSGATGSCSTCPVAGATVTTGSSPSAGSASAPSASTRSRSATSAPRARSSLVHGVDVEGLAAGIDLAAGRTARRALPGPHHLRRWGAVDRRPADRARRAARAGSTSPSAAPSTSSAALSVRYADCVAFNRSHSRGPAA